jgi:hypothetical protein
MTVAYLDLGVDRGADWTQSFTWSYGDTSTPVDLSGAACRFTIRNSPDTVNGTTLLALTAGSGVTLGGAAGTVAIALTKAQSAAIPRGTYWYDCYVDFAVGTTTRLLTGQMTFS